MWALASKVFENESWQWGLVNTGWACRAVNFNFSNGSKISSMVVKDLRGTDNRKLSLLVFNDFMVQRRSWERTAGAGLFFSVRWQCWDHRAEGRHWGPLTGVAPSMALQGTLWEASCINPLAPCSSLPGSWRLLLPKLAKEKITSTVCSHNEPNFYLIANFNNS